MTYCKYISYNLYYSNIVNMFIALLFYSMTNVDKALGLFEAEMKAQDLWDAVTVVTVSDFGRTLTFNGLGTDHAWGGNYFIAGGNVSGAQIHGRYPDRLTEEESNLNIGRGRILPTLPWESMWEGLAQWMGVPASDMATVLPNLKKFPASHRLNSSELFDVDPPRSEVVAEAPATTTATKATATTTAIPATSKLTTGAPTTTITSVTVLILVLILGY